MGAPFSVTVDVRDMVCAQALAVVAQALGRVQAGDAVEVLFNAEDVKLDLLVWAKDRGYSVLQVDKGALAIRC